MRALPTALAAASADPPWGLAFALLAVAALLVVTGLVALVRARRFVAPPTPRETR